MRHKPCTVTISSARGKPLATLEVDAGGNIKPTYHWDQMPYELEEDGLTDFATGESVTISAGWAYFDRLMADGCSTRQVRVTYH